MSCAGNVGGNIVLAALRVSSFSKSKERRKNYREERERGEFFKVLLSTEEKETRESRER